jgi:hypothetical protein
MEKIILFILILVITLGCDKNKVDEDCIEYRTAFVRNVTAPSNGTTNNDIPIEVSFTVINGCGNFSEFLETRNGNNKSIEVQTKYEGCICTQAVETLSVIYVFNEQTTGFYELIFRSSDTNFISVSITIE